MRILIVHNFYQQEGGENVVAQQEIDRLRLSDDIYEYQRHNDEIKSYGISQKVQFFTNTIYSTTTVADVKKIVKEFRPDFAYIHNIYPLISPSIYHTLHACGVPILQVVHDFRPFCSNGLFYTHDHICTLCKDGNHLHAIANKCYKGSYVFSALYAATMYNARHSGAIDKVDAFLALTEFGRDLVTGMGIPADKVFIRPNSIDASEITPSYGPGEYIAYIGRLSSEKGIMTLLRSMQQLNGIKLKIAGAGPLEEELRAFVSQHPNLNVEFVGFLTGEQKIEFFQKSRFVVVPSEWYETFGMIIVEAYAAGKPIVASNLGGLGSLVQNNVTGLLFNPGDATDLAQKIDSLWHNPELAVTMGQRARAVVEDKFSPATVHRQLIEIAQQMIARRQQKAAV
jgi:glycosyltransferase involved in cell wall biosynthesis